MELHPLLAQRKVVGVLFRKGVQCVASKPLAHGDAELMSSPEVQEVAAETGRTAKEVVVKWNTQRGVPVTYLLDGGELLDLQSFFSWKLTNDQKVDPLSLLSSGMGGGAR